MFSSLSLVSQALAESLARLSSPQREDSWDPLQPQVSWQIPELITIPSLALCLAVAGCVSPFSGLFLIFTIRSRCKPFTNLCVEKCFSFPPLCVQGDGPTPDVVSAPPPVQNNLPHRLLLHLSLQHALQVHPGRHQL